jgi:hypothetical protein
MTPEERAFLIDLQHRAHQLAGLFGAVVQEAGRESIAGKLAYKGGLQALEICNLTADRVLRAEHAAELAEGNYDLAALASALPPSVEE